MRELMKAIYDVVDEHGAGKIADGAEFTSRTLVSQKANPNCETHRMNVEELHRIMKFTQDFRPLAAWAAAFGFELVAKEAPAPQALTASMIGVGKEVAELTLAVHTALDDNHVSSFEKAQIRVEINHVRARLDVMEASVKVA